MAARACDPRLRVAAVIPREGGIVLVKHRAAGREYHLLPGGGVEAGETLADALRREVLEETGITCEPGALLFLNDSIDPDGSRHMVQATFLAREIDRVTAFQSSDNRVVGAEVVAVSTLAELDLRPPMADALAGVAASDYRSPAVYLGPLWVNENGITGTDSSA